MTDRTYTSLGPGDGRSASRGGFTERGGSAAAHGGFAFGSKGKPHHNFGTCIACAACAVACDPRAIEIFIDEDEGTLVWMLDFELCTSCGECHLVCPTGAMGLLPGANPADEAEPPKRCVFALAECDECGRYYASRKEVAYANRLLSELDHADAALARAMTKLCPECKRIRDAKAADRRRGLGRA